MNIHTKGIDPSYLGKIDITATSTNDPGTTFSLTPFVKVNENLYFSEKMGVDQISYKEWKEKNNL